jgi:hypothetical protein
MSKAGRRAVWSLLGAAAMYVWGFLSMLAVPDIEEVCGSHNQYWEFDRNHRESLFPLSNPCNPTYDLVPPYVNPALFALLALSAVFTVIAIRQRVRRGKT